MKIFFFLLTLILGAWWIGQQIYDNHRNSEKEPFWQGTEMIQVCKTPYYSSHECYKLMVTLIDNKTTQIHFTNGGYKYTYDLTCYLSAKNPLYDNPDYVFCRSIDEEDQQWDFMPVWAYLPSPEEETKKTEQEFNLKIDNTKIQGSNQAMVEKCLKEIDTRLASKESMEILRGIPATKENLELLLTIKKQAQNTCYSKYPQN